MKVELIGGRWKIKKSKHLRVSVNKFKLPDWLEGHQICSVNLERGRVTINDGLGDVMMETSSQEMIQHQKILITRFESDIFAGIIVRATSDMSWDSYNQLLRFRHGEERGMTIKKEVV